ncbi:MULTISPECIES: FtsX-like permease family protein [Bacillus cereus group]|uniref:FtsX-like permease family protein n=1 Tax=Bacillus cereus group TaxID=86661 RepID=UPI0022E39070|nr:MULTISPECIES: ABC transporter permease [unclassified Bacillus cereus group]MDA2665450.1 ABC transporter permease [Bacillus cereus group sp. Bc032]MDA2676214.1 ABC transporter permease [Bacillus cereus group sp. Bc031]MDA2681720.1 ABC transporter permease [Bacillus cereus group sp. Bc029]MDA2687153.1 ABC transporter permease [Bacillus cereus group sp. Bc030]MDA2742664.1 ABC transporter permease [Bacillus cereus group sp. Bc011]
MLFKLSRHSMKKMLKDYMVLLIGLVISISIFYMFQTMAMNSEFTKDNSLISSIRLVFWVGAILLSFITVFYIIYANSFLLTLRRKELGMYMMLGAKKKKVAQLLFIETFGMGIVSIIIGILVGMLLASVAGNFLMNGMEISAKGSYSSVYTPAIIVTAILELIREDETLDEVKKSKTRIIIMTVLGVLLVSTGYYFMINVKIYAEFGFIIATIVTTLGTYFIFSSLLPFFVMKIKGNKKRNETGLNSFTYAQLRFRVNSLSRVLGTVTMLIALGAGAMTAGMAFQKNVDIMTDFSRVYDVVIHDPNEQDTAALKEMEIVEESKYKYKVDGETVYYLRNDLTAKPPLVSDHFDTKTLKEPVRKRVTEPLTEPVYSALEAPELAKFPRMPRDWEDAIVREIQITHNQFNGKPVRIADEAHYKGIQGTEHIVTLAKVDDMKKYKPLLIEIDKRQKEQIEKTTGAKVDLFTKMTIYQFMNSFMSGTMFMGFFLGIAFLAMMASSLMFKILTGASRDVRRYEMLRKIGVRRSMLTKSIYKEISYLFIFPAIIGISHVLVGLNLFSFILVDPFVKVWVPIGIFLVIYFIYYWITVQLYKGMVMPKEEVAK